MFSASSGTLSVSCAVKIPLFASRYPSLDFSVQWTNDSVLSIFRSLPIGMAEFPRNLFGIQGPALHLSAFRLLGDSSAVDSKGRPASYSDA
jgi:hypothetical protein